MAGFSAVEAALEGFRLTRKNPRAFRTWIGLNIAGSVLAVLADVFMPSSIRHGLDALGADEVLTLGQFLDAIILSAPVLIFALAIHCMMSAAVYRLIFRHEDDRFGYVRLGMDELRLMATTSICFVLFMVVVVLATVVVGIVLALVGTLVRLSLYEVQFLTFAGVVAAFAFFFVRFSLAPVATFAERRVVIWESWTLTRGHFWKLFTSYALTALCLLLVIILIVAVCFGVAGTIMVVTGGNLSNLRGVFTANGASLSSYLSVGVVAYMLVSSVFSALYNAVIAAPPAVAYEHYHGAPPAPPLAAQPEAV